MKKLENFVKNNRKEFDSFELPECVWDKIAQELDKKQPKKPGRMYTMISAAAAIIVLFGLVWMYTVKTNYSEIQMADINPAFAKKAVHFASQIAVKRDSLETFAKTDPNLYKQFSADLKTLDAEYEKLKSELKSTPNQEFAVKAMVRNREMQLQILNQQLSVINQVNQYKNEKENSL